MSDANQLKIRARREEAAGEYEKASRLYLEALSAMDHGGGLSDPSLLVRVADLEYRQDHAESALEYYLRAVDEYSDQGLITNAIAVCNKILRVFPDEVDCHRRLAELHMDVGLAAEARQNLLRFANEAWDPEHPEPVVEGARGFLRRSADQEVAVDLASRLREAGRAEEALEVLEAVWRERSREGSDVEALKRKAEEIHGDTSDAAWSGAAEEAAEEAGEEAGSAAEAAEDEAAAGTGSGGRGSWSGENGAAADGAPVEAEPEAAADGETSGGGADDEPSDGAAEEDERAGGAGDTPPGRERLPGGDPLAAAIAGAGGPSWRAEPREGDDGGEGDGDRSAPAGAGRVLAGRGAPAGPPGELELVASYRERFIEVHPPFVPDGGGSPAAGDGGERTAAGNGGVDRDRPGQSGAGSGANATRGAPSEPTANADANARREDEVMGELDEMDRESDVGTSVPDTGDPGASGLAGLDGEPPPGGTAEDEAGGRPGRPADEELGERAELRRGLELVDEMLEMQPDNRELRERKLRYARRLGDRDVVVGASLDFAEGLVRDGARRSARELYRRVLELDPGNRDAESGLARLDVGDLEEKRRSAERAGEARGSSGEPSSEEEAARRELGGRLWSEFESSIREMPWLHAATQAYQAAGPDGAPPVETFEMLARYLVARGQHRDAAETLERALEVADGGDERVADVLYQLGRVHEEIGEDERAAAYFERLERVDPEFARVRDTTHGGGRPDDG